MKMDPPSLETYEWRLVGEVAGGFCGFVDGKPHCSGTVDGRNLAPPGMRKTL